MSRLRDQVKAFHGACGIETPATPVVPDDDAVRLRLRLIAEEFFELLDAAGCDVECAIPMTERAISDSENLSLPEFIDALGDIDYVVEGTRLAFGVDGGPIADAIQAANMAKCVNGKIVRAPNGKILKPEGWAPPDIAGELRKQGWRQ